MFSNPGTRMKRMAVIVFWVTLLTMAVTGLALVMVLDDAMGGKPLFVIAGCLLTAGFSFLCAYLKALRMSALGELAENSSVLRLRAEAEVKEGDDLI